MKNLLIIPLLFISLNVSATAFDLPEKPVTNSCIAKTLASIKKEPQCNLFVSQVKAIPQPNCAENITVTRMAIILASAKQYNCMVNLSEKQQKEIEKESRMMKE